MLCSQVPALTNVNLPLRKIKSNDSDSVLWIINSNNNNKKKKKNPKLDNGGDTPSLRWLPRYLPTP